jgi:hypothetical protein
MVEEVQIKGLFYQPIRDLYEMYTVIVIIEAALFSCDPGDGVGIGL